MWQYENAGRMTGEKWRISAWQCCGFKMKSPSPIQGIELGYVKDGANGA